MASGNKVLLHHREIVWLFDVAFSSSQVFVLLTMYKYIFILCLFIRFFYVLTFSVTLYYDNIMLNLNFVNIL